MGAGAGELLRLNELPSDLPPAGALLRLSYSVFWLVLAVLSEMTFLLALEADDGGKVAVAGLEVVGSTLRFGMGDGSKLHGGWSVA